MLRVASPTSREAPCATSQTPVPTFTASTQEASPSSGAAAVATYTAIAATMTTNQGPRRLSTPAKTPRNHASGTAIPAGGPGGSMVCGRDWDDADRVEVITPWLSTPHPTTGRVGRRVAFKLYPSKTARTWAAASEGVLPTLTPAASRASCLAWAVPEEPDTIAPACPMVLPSGAVNPAM